MNTSQKTMMERTFIAHANVAMAFLQGGNASTALVLATQLLGREVTTQSGMGYSPEFLLAREQMRAIVEALS